MTIHASSGAKLYICSTVSLDVDDQSGYEALSWTEVGEIENIAEFGDSAQQGSFTSLSDNRVRKFKGAFDAGDVNISLAHDPLDAGQVILKTAAASKFRYPIKVTLEDSKDANDTDSVFYFQALVMSNRLNIGGANDVTKRTVPLAIDTAIVEVASTSVP